MIPWGFIVMVAGDMVVTLLLLVILILVVLFIIRLAIGRSPSRRAAVGVSLVILILGIAAGIYSVSMQYGSDTDVAAAKPATITACRASNLALSTAPGENGGNSRSYELYVTNRSQPCTLSGYPYVQLLNGAGAAVGSPANHFSTTAPQTFRLEKDGRAQVTLTVTFSAYDTCKDGVTSLRVSPDGATDSLTTKTDIGTWCPRFVTTAFAPVA